MNVVQSLERADRCKRIARVAQSLRLDRSHCSLLHPILVSILVEDVARLAVNFRTNLYTLLSS